MRNGVAACPGWLVHSVMAGAIAAQCAPQFTPLLQCSGVRGSVTATALWDPDGPGPLSTRLVVGSGSLVAGATLSPHVAVFDFASQTWSGLGDGISSSTTNTGVNGPWPPSVLAIAALPNGELVVAGSFTNAGRRPAANIARWNGTGWSPLGSGTDGTVQSLAVLANGDLVAAGTFQHAGGQWANGVARWNGTAWIGMGTGLYYSPSSTTNLLLRRTNGDLILANSAFLPPSFAACLLTRWNGSAWQALGSPPFQRCTQLAETPSGTLLAGGGFSGTSSPASRVHAWNGATWAQLGAATSFTYVSALLPLTNGDVLAAGYDSTTNTYGFDRLTSGTSSWTLEAPANDWIHRLHEVPGGGLLAAGAFTALDDEPIANLAQNAGSGWLDLGQGGTNGPAADVVATPTGHAIVGNFTRVEGVPANRVAQWSGGAWSAMGTGVDGPATKIARRSNGDLIVGGSFTHAGGIAVQGLARWNGSAWSSLGYIGTTITQILVLPNDDVVVADWNNPAGTGGFGRIQRWNGSSWTTLGTPGSQLTSLIGMPNGDLVAAGSLYWMSGVQVNGCARWNGATWSNLNQWGITALEATPGGSLLAAGKFWLPPNNNTFQMLARWNGSTWNLEGPTALDGNPAGLAQLSTPDLLLYGNVRLVEGLPTRPPIRITGTTWWNLGDAAGAVLGDEDFGSGLVTGKAALPNGDLLLVGTFQELAGIPAAGLLRLTPGCSPKVGTYPNPCVGPTGPLHAMATSAPTIGGTLTTQCTGFAANSLGVAVFGTAALPYPGFWLSAATPLGMPGCQLIPRLDLLPTAVPSNGVAQCALGIANAPALIGLLLWHQYVQVELGGTGIASLSASNALQIQLQ